MIDQETFRELKAWFSAYVKSFQSENPEHQRNLDLKKDHTKRVCDEIREIGNSLALNEEELRLAETIALLHDIGRFEQYQRYKTFSDIKSEDHAALGIKLLYENGVLSGLDPSTRELILSAISNHNRAKLPEGVTEKCLFFTKLLRDADKLDILRVVTDYYQRRNEPHNAALELELPDSSEISDKICADLMAEKSPDVKYVKTLNDFKLLQMGLIYDVNFQRTFQLIQERRYLEIIRDVLPHSEKIRNVYSTLRSYLEKNCRSDAFK
jgi:HD superfamily phosphodiesterase